MFVCLLRGGGEGVTCRRGRGFQRIFELCQFRCSLVNGHGPLIDGSETQHISNWLLCVSVKSAREGEQEGR